MNYVDPLQLEVDQGPRTRVFAYTSHKRTLAPASYGGETYVGFSGLARLLIVADVKRLSGSGAEVTLVVEMSDTGLGGDWTMVDSHEFTGNGSNVAVVAEPMNYLRVRLIDGMWSNVSLHVEVIPGWIGRA